MITGTAAWTNALNAETKRPLYLFRIPNKSISLCSFFPLNLVTGASSALPILQIPTGASQAVDELTAHSSISGIEITAIDPSGALKTLAADASVIGQPCTLSMGFPGLDVATDFVTIHSGTITAVSRTQSGLMRISISDRLLILVNDIFLSGGPTQWIPGQALTTPPRRPPAVLGNGQPISDQNPRYLSGHPLDLLLVALQNELGFGQITPPALIVSASGGSGTGQVGYGINTAWRFYTVSDPTTLINPNSYVDVPGILSLRDSQFTGLQMEFTLTGPVGGKSWIENQLLKPLGLYWITRADGKLALKSMKHPATVAPVTISERQTLDIPDLARWPLINMVACSMPLRSTDVQDRGSVTFVQQSSLNTYRSPYVHTIDSDGLRFGLGASAQLFLLANRIFNRHAFSTPVYTVRTFLKHFVIELGDFIRLTHPKVLDLKTGTLGISNVLCEVIDRQPDYASGAVTFKMIDTRFISTGSGGFQIANSSAGIPVWGSASAGQKAQFMFIADRNGVMSDLAAGNPIQ